MTVVMMGQMSLENQVEKSDKKNDQDQIDRMRQEVYSKGLEMHNEMTNRHCTLRLYYHVTQPYQYINIIEKSTYNTNM